MNNAPADPLSWYWDIPVVTRVYLTGAFVTTVSLCVSVKSLSCFSIDSRRSDFWGLFSDIPRLDEISESAVSGKWTLLDAFGQD